MAETVVVETDENTGLRFSWGLAFAGGVVAAAVIFFLLALGSGFGLLLIDPVRHSGPSTPAFLTGGAIYFLAAQVFGFAVGGHLAGRLLGPLAETRGQEEFRAAAHGLVAWAVTILATLALLVLAGLVAVGGATALSPMHGVHASETPGAPFTAYLVDVLFRPAGDGGQANALPAPMGNAPDAGAHAEAARLLQTGYFSHAETLSAADRARLIDLVSDAARIPAAAAANRVDRMQSDVRTQTRQTADAARRAASYASLWIAVSLIFGAIVAMFAAVSARLEDDRSM